MGAGETSTRSRRRAVPWAVLALWIGLLAVVGPFAAKLSDVQHDRAVDYLPSSADSTRVAKTEDSLPGGESTELVLVYHRDGGSVRPTGTPRPARSPRSPGRTRSPAPLVPCRPTTAAP